MPFVALYHTHKLVVVLFLLIYLVKAILLVANKTEGLRKFTGFVKIPEMIVSALFFITGVMMLSKIAVFTSLLAIKLVVVVVAIPVAVIAYKKFNKLLAIIALFLLVAAYGLAEMNRASFGKRKPVSAVTTDPTQAGYSLNGHGMALYKAQCMVCHGKDGKAKLSGAKDLTLSQMTDPEIRSIVEKGKNAMPPMHDLFNEQEMKALVSYVKSLR